jgi:acetolactate synthase regulatory subunit
MWRRKEIKKQRVELEVQSKRQMKTLTEHIAAAREVEKEMEDKNRAKWMWMRKEMRGKERKVVWMWKRKEIREKEQRVELEVQSKRVMKRLAE